MKKNVKKVSQNIDSTELIMAMDELEKEKGIKKEFLLESIESALVTAYKKNFDVNAENVKITMNKETGEIHVYAEYTVVEEVEDEKTQISLEEAKKIECKIYSRRYSFYRACTKEFWKNSSTNSKTSYNPKN